MVGRVQECGCIALPEELQAKTGLYPGATYEIEVSAEGNGLVLVPLEAGQSKLPKLAAECGSLRVEKA
jgi:bifunctional DNA-binding transcriptional regulator/antitoxin component of YhaV-PrlF toxin-antitoxin module